MPTSRPCRCDPARAWWRGRRSGPSAPRASPRALTCTSSSGYAGPRSIPRARTDGTMHPTPRRGTGPAVTPQITLTPTSEDDAPALRALHSTPQVAQWWDLPDPGFPMDDEPESTRFTIRYGGEIAG